MISQEQVRDYSTAIENLFSEWRKRKNSDLHIDHSTNFIEDGVICPETWFSQSIRPLFLLKEAYDGDADHADLRKHITRLISKDDKTPSITLKRVAEWASGIFSTNEKTIKPFSHFETQENILEIFKQIAIVNIKKSNGQSSSNAEDIANYANFDAEQLKAEITLCDPTIIICGNTGSTNSILNTIFKENICYTKGNPHYEENLYYTFYLNNHMVLVLDYWHPAAISFPDLLKYYGLMGIYQQALITNKSKSQTSHL